MTKLVFFSDLHAHAFPEFGAAERLNDCLSVLTEVRLYCIEKKIEHVFFGGDMFHKRGVLWTSPYVRVANELKLFREAEIAFYAVDGNHDHEDKEGTVHALQPLIAGSLLRGIGAKGYRVIELSDCNVTMFAYCDSKDTLAARIEAAQKVFGTKKRNVGLFHHGFKGARVGSTLEYEVKEPIDAKQLRLDRLFDLTLSGHYHTHQRIVGIKRGWYVGSPLEHTRSDRCARPKGFLVLDTETMKLERVALKRPRFVTVNVGDALDDVEGNFVDVVYAAADDSLDVFLAAVKQRGARGVNPVPLPSAKQQTKRRLNVSPELAPGKVLKRYVKHKKRELKKMDRVAILQLGLELIREAGASK